jgi:hypothetical protein
MTLVLQRAIGRVLPLEWQLRRISQTAEMLLTHVNLYAAVSAARVHGRKRVLLELRSPVAVSAQVLEQLRLYLARKLNAVLGLTLEPQQLLLVSLPPADASPQQAPTSSALEREIPQLPLWSARGRQAHAPAAQPRDAAQAVAVPAAANDTPAPRASPPILLDDGWIGLRGV